MKTIDELMAEHGISVWEDPHWNEGRVGTPRWLAGVNLSYEVLSSGCETCGYGEEAAFTANSTAAGETPSAAVMACAALISGSAS